MSIDFDSIDMLWRHVVVGDISGDQNSRNRKLQHAISAGPPLQ
uniref:Uncharacterized protein n=1 Tax=Rhizobium rhizogenes TaxID=359 RepID=A0A7S4ZS54_RHIRH|nr:hypothetical protein pC5.8b_482 [Rhizobium rhizogenes]